MHVTLTDFCNIDESPQELSSVLTPALAAIRIFEGPSTLGALGMRTDSRAVNMNIIGNFGHVIGMTMLECYAVSHDDCFEMAEDSY